MFQRIKNIMRLFLGSNLLKKGVTWGFFKGSIIFALGFHTNRALNPNLGTVIKEAEQSLDEAMSLSDECDARIAKLKETRKLMVHLMQLYDARMAELEEVKKANGR
ncbi:unnamed protein product [Microthlaspi erraticum]|uniref:Uncharacterized protein n=1 Tax=Microthlaspi erraticum TaxID=1685480 RepID=A0A6D2I9N9_9BRAS|nr:unnamed protein product [Microthlaspi erraticum]